MTSVIVRDGENFEQALRRFKKLVERAGIQTELRKREYYEKPSVEACIQKIKKIILSINSILNKG